VSTSATHTPDDTLKMIGIPNNRYSHSMGECFRTCPWQYCLRYLKDVKEQPYSSLVWGNIMHAGLDWAAQLQLAGNPRPSAKQIGDYMGDDCGPFQINKAERQRPGSGIEWKGNDTKDVLIADARRAIVPFEHSLGQYIEPVEAEKYFRLELENYDFELSGKRDLFTVGGRLVDYKTGARALHETAAMTSPQLKMYQLAKEAEGVTIVDRALYGIIRLKGSTTIQPIVEPPATPEEMGEFLDNIAETVRALRAGVFPRADDWETCTGFCGLTQDCHPEWYARKQAIVARKRTANGNN